MVVLVDILFQLESVKDDFQKRPSKASTKYSTAANNNWDTLRGSGTSYLVQQLEKLMRAPLLLLQYGRYVQQLFLFMRGTIPTPPQQIRNCKTRKIK